jgi:hypothetical protein
MMTPPKDDPQYLPDVRDRGLPPDDEDEDPRYLPTLRDRRIHRDDENEDEDEGGLCDEDEDEDVVIEE